MDAPLTVLRTRVKIGADSLHSGLRSHRQPMHSWLESYALSPLLDQYGILHMGIVRASVNYEVTRVESPYTHFVACIDGAALLWINGRQHRLTPGTACILPHGSSHMDRTNGEKPWHFCYVCYHNRSVQSGNQYQIVSVVSGLALDDYNWAPAGSVNSEVDTWTSNGMAIQRWWIEPGPSGGSYYNLINVYSGMALDTQSASTISNAPVVQNIPTWLAGTQEGSFQAP